MATDPSKGMTTTAPASAGTVKKKDHHVFQYVEALQKMPKATGLEKNLISEEYRFSEPYPGYSYRAPEVPTSFGFAEPQLDDDDPSAAEITQTQVTVAARKCMIGQRDFTSVDKLRINTMGPLLESIECNISDCVTANDYAIRLHQVLEKQFDLNAKLSTDKLLGRTRMADQEVSNIDGLKRMNDRLSMEVKNLKEKLAGTIKRPQVAELLRQATKIRSDTHTLRKEVAFMFADAQEFVRASTERIGDEFGGKVAVEDNSRRKDIEAALQQHRQANPLKNPSNVLKECLMLLAGEVNDEFVENTTLLCRPKDDETKHLHEEVSVDPTSATGKWKELLAYDGPETPSVAKLKDAAETVRVAARLLSSSQMESAQLKNKIKGMELDIASLNLTVDELSESLARAQSKALASTKSSKSLKSKASFRQKTAEVEGEGMEDNTAPPSPLSRTSTANQLLTRKKSIKAPDAAITKVETSSPKSQQQGSSNKGKQPKSLGGKSTGTLDRKASKVSTAKKPKQDDDADPTDNEPGADQGGDAEEKGDDNNNNNNNKEGAGDGEGATTANDEPFAQDAPPLDMDGAPANGDQEEDEEEATGIVGSEHPPPRAAGKQVSSKGGAGKRVSISGDRRKSSLNSKPTMKHSSGKGKSPLKQRPSAAAKVEACDPEEEGIALHSSIESSKRKTMLNVLGAFSKSEDAIIAVAELLSAGEEDTDMPAEEVENLPLEDRKAQVTEVVNTLSSLLHEEARRSSSTNEVLAPSTSVTEGLPQEDKEDICQSVEIEPQEGPAALEATQVPASGNEEEGKDNVGEIGTIQEKPSTPVVEEVEEKPTEEEEEKRPVSPAPVQKKKPSPVPEKIVEKRKESPPRKVTPPPPPAPPVKIPAKGAPKTPPPKITPRKLPPMPGAPSQVTPPTSPTPVEKDKTPRSGAHTVTTPEPKPIAAVSPSIHTVKDDVRDQIRAIRTYASQASESERNALKSTYPPSVLGPWASSSDPPHQGAMMRSDYEETKMESSPQIQSMRDFLRALPDLPSRSGPRPESSGFPSSMLSNEEKTVDDRLKFDDRQSMPLPRRDPEQYRVGYTPPSQRKPRKLKR